MPSEGVLVECIHKKEVRVMKSSGVLFDGGLVLTGGLLLSPLLGTKWMESAMNNLRSTPGVMTEFQDCLKFKVYRENPRKEFQAVILAAWRCPLVRETLRSLSDWKFESDSGSIENFLSIMFILGIGEVTSSWSSNLPGIVRELAVPSRCENVVVESTPFGDEFFFNSYSRGVISNVFGRQQCLFLTDARAVSGCEGGPVYLDDNRGQKAQLVGLILHTLSHWQGEWAGLSVGVSLLPVLTRLLPPSKTCGDFVNRTHSIKVRELVDETIVMVTSGTHWGSGVVIDSFAGIIVTCSHVLPNSKKRIYVFHKGKYYSSEVIYKTSNDLAYDIAVLRVTTLGAFTKQMELAEALPEKGTTVIVAGYPLFSERGNYNLRPTIVSGCISKVSSAMIQTTCTIQHGASGGAVISDKKLIGLMVSNTKDSTSGAVFPHVNYVIPVSVFGSQIINYTKTRNLDHLRHLESSDDMVQRLWRLQNFKI